MATERVEIEGLEELEAALAEVTDKKVAWKSLRSALAKGGRVIANQAKRNAPVESGALRQSIGIFSRKGKRGDRVSAVFIGPKVKNKTAIRKAQAAGRDIKGIYYGHIVEQGSVHSAPAPFLRPALDQAAGVALGKFVQDLREKLNDVD